MGELQKPRGTRDVLPEEASRWRLLEDRARQVAARYGYGELRTPLFEVTELFRRGVGEDTDIVGKEMYTFLDRKGRDMTLRPEGTAPAVRAFLEHNLGAGPQPVRLFYLQPAFRYERPEEGRWRQHHQFGAECFGAAGAAADAEVIALAVDFLRTAGVADFRLRLNSIGCPACRPAYRAALREYYRPLLPLLCADCQERFGQNPLRLLDCKVDTAHAAGAPRTADHLCTDCREHLQGLEALLARLRISFDRDPTLVRGLDYYTRTVFELESPRLGSQSALGGGGRYDGLVELLGGQPTPAVGGGVGLERTLLALEAGGAPAPTVEPPQVFVASVGEEYALEAMGVASQLRSAGVRVITDPLGRSLKAQLKQAARAGARWTVILGEELSRWVLVLRDMAAGVQEEVPAGELLTRIDKGVV